MSFPTKIIYIRKKNIAIEMKVKRNWSTAIKQQNEACDIYTSEVKARKQKEKMTKPYDIL